MKDFAKNIVTAKLAKNSDLVIFLGGADTEMVRIAEVVREAGCEEVRDAGLSWGTKASAYGDEIAEVAASGKIPILIELEIDIDLPETAVVVDHHGDRAGEPPAILQVLDLLGIEPTRWDFLVAANDAGWYPGLAGIAEIPGMGFLSPPATQEEMKKVRSGDYGLQGITPEMLAEIDRALAAPVEMIGSIRVVRMSHSKCGPIGDHFAIPAFANREPIPQYVVFSEDGETNFSGDGALCAELHEKFGGWSGGAGLGKAGETAFWGGYADQKEIEDFLKAKFS